MKSTTLAALGIGCGALFLIPGCGKREEAVREELRDSGYELTPQAYFQAARSDDTKALARLIEAGIPSGVRNEAGDSAMHAAAAAGMEKSIRFLLDRGLDVDLPGAKGRTPLMTAVTEGQPSTVRFLLKQGADPLKKDEDGFKPLMIAVREGRSDMIAELAPYDREDLDNALLAAALLGQPKVIDELTNYGASLYARMDDGRTALMLAAQNGNVEAVQLLLEIGANRFAMDEQGRIAADLAREAGYEDLALTLSAAPADDEFGIEEPVGLGEELLAAFEPPSEGEPASVNPGSLGNAGDPSLERGASRPAGDSGRESGVYRPTVSRGTIVPLEGAVVALTRPRTGSAPATGPGDRRNAAAERATLGQSASSDGALDGSTSSTGGASGGSASAPGKTTGGSGANEELPTRASGEPSESIGLVMRSYRQKELPLRVESVAADGALIRVAGSKPTKVTVGERIPGSPLKVVRVERRMRETKLDSPHPMDVSIVEIEDGSTGLRRELVVGLPATGHDPLALVEDANGTRYVARAGQKFRGADGTVYSVVDVRPNQMVIEENGSGEVWTIPLRGPRG